MTCSYCKNEMIESKTTYVEEIGDKIIVIKNVPCYKCGECGEVHYTMSVLMKIEALVEKLKATLKEDTIVNFPAA